MSFDIWLCCASNIFDFVFMGLDIMDTGIALNINYVNETKGECVKKYY